MKKLILILTLSSTLTSCSYFELINIPTIKPEIHLLNGSIAAARHYHISEVNIKDSCTNNEIKDDVKSFNTVQIKNETGKLIGNTQLGIGQIENRGLYMAYTGQQEADIRCVFTFYFTGIPKATFYTVNIVGAGEKTYSYEELKSGNWHINLSVDTHYVQK